MHENGTLRPWRVSRLCAGGTPAFTGSDAHCPREAGSVGAGFHQKGECGTTRLCLAVIGPSTFYLSTVGEAAAVCWVIFSFLFQRSKCPDLQGSLLYLL